jgi:CopG family nickel-responsive transcriptional regulator
VRDIIRKNLVTEEWEKGIGTVVGSITIMYDHDSHNVVEKLAELQHQNHSIIHNSSQVRLDEHACLEVIIVQGSPFEIKELADKVQAIKGVKHAELARCTVK